MVVGICEEEVHEHCHPLDDIDIFSNRLELFVEILVSLMIARQICPCVATDSWFNYHIRIVTRCLGWF